MLALRCWCRCHVVCCNFFEGVNNHLSNNLTALKLLIKGIMEIIVGPLMLKKTECPQWSLKLLGPNEVIKKKILKINE